MTYIIGKQNLLKGLNKTTTKEMKTKEKRQKELEDLRIINL